MTDPRPEHPQPTRPMTGPQRSPEVLLQAALEDSPAVVAVLDELGLTPAAVVGVLVEAGVVVPVAPSGPQLPVTAISFPAAERDRVLYALVIAYPPGSAVTWGWELAGSSCLVTVTGPGAGAVAEVVRETVADPRAVVVADPVLPDSGA